MIAPRPKAIALVLLLAESVAAQLPGPGALVAAATCQRTVTAGSPVDRGMRIMALLDSSRELVGVRATTVMALRKPGCPAWWSGAEAHGWVNTGAANVDADGPVWQGRGVTAATSSGIFASRGWLSAQLRPVIVLSQNASFRPGSDSDSIGNFRDPVLGSRIDLPYRLGGAGVYAAMEPGESFVRADFGRYGFGISTQNLQWGSALNYPLLLGVEAAGYPRMFAETRDLSLRIMRVSAQWHLGLLEASPYAAALPGSRSRAVSAFAASVRPAGLEALEVGAARLFHVRRTPGSLNLSTATLPFSGILKTQSRDAVVGGYNQLASAFVRIAPAGSGIEVYAEFLREDHNANLRDAIGEPDHASAYTIGMRRAWKSGEGAMAVTIERANARSTHLSRVRAEDPVYVHSTVTEGHTHRGQGLGSSVLLAGGGTAITWHRLAPARSMFAGVRIEGSETIEPGAVAIARAAYVLEAGLLRNVGGSTVGFTARAQFGGRGHAPANANLGLSLLR